jgi:hypothetical protein
MRTDQLTWSDTRGWQPSAGVRNGAQLVLYFGASDALRTDAWFRELQTMYPNAHIVGCSSGGQIQHAEFSETGIAAIAVDFAATRLRIATESVVNPSQSRTYGAALGRQLSDKELVGVFVLSDGLNVNGSELVRGLLSELGSTVRVSGGLAGDGARFAKTRVGADALPQPSTIAAIGFYGAAVRFGFNCTRSPRPQMNGHPTTPLY